MFKLSTAVAGVFVAGMGLAFTLAACSQGGIGGFVPISQGGQAGSTSTSQGGTGGFSNSNGGSGTAGSSGTGGTGGQGPMCAAYRMCNPGDQQVGMDCPAERECYTLSLSCGSGQYNTTTCVLPVGVHCDDPLLCNPGDTQTTFGDQGWIGCADPDSCYQLNLCAYFIMCRYGADAGVDANSLDARMDAGTPDAGVDGRTMRSCGNGILEPNYGEKCDDGNTNNGDGCNAICQIEAGWQCPIPGQSCIPCGTNACDAGPAGYCGDGVIEAGEECDCGDGTISVPGGCPGPNNDNTYGDCTTRCTWGPRCGDNIVQTNHGEQCDMGSLNGVPLDGNGNPSQNGIVQCEKDCTIFFCCVL